MEIIKKNSNKKLLIFDLDGTLYQFKKGSFKQSGIYKKVLENTEKYIVIKLHKTNKEAKKILLNILDEYGESISIALEEKFNFNRYDYFNTAWDIPAHKYIKSNPGLRKILLEIKKNYRFALVSDAPKIWIKSVLKELKIDDIFRNNIFSGEGDQRKEFHNVFEIILKTFKIKPINCIAFGDQENTDIIPANKLGIKTILISRNDKFSSADYVIKNILEIKEALKYLENDEKFQ